MTANRELEQLVRSNPQARQVFKYLSERERNRGTTTLRILRRELKNNVSKETLTSIFESLEDLGIGELKYTKVGTAVTFIWNYRLIDVGLSGLGHKVPLELLPRHLETNTKSMSDEFITLKIPASLLRVLRDKSGELR